MFPDVSEDTTQHKANHRIHADDEKHILLMFLNLFADREDGDGK
jgi:1,2-phenylacetyl-CoA epoxidase PaaB subunit